MGSQPKAHQELRSTLKRAGLSLTLKIRKLRPNLEATQQGQDKGFTSPGTGVRIRATTDSNELALISPAEEHTREERWGFSSSLLVWLFIHS